MGNTNNNLEKKKISEADIFGMILGFGLAILISKSYNLGFIPLLVLTLVFYYICKYITIALGAKEKAPKTIQERDDDIGRWFKLIGFSIFYPIYIIFIIYNLSGKIDSANIKWFIFCVLAILPFVLIYFKRRTNKK